MKNLEKHIDDYLLWMFEVGYEETTILLSDSVLKRFKFFVKGKKDTAVFTYQTLTEFREITGLKKTWRVVKNFAEYLFNHNIIPVPIEKPVVILPIFFEQYIDYCDKVKEVSKGTMNRIRRVLTAFNNYLDATNISLKVLKIEHVDGFLSKYNNGYVIQTSTDNRSIVRGFLKYLYHNEIIKRNLATILIGATVFAQSKPPKFLRPDEIQQLLKSLRNAVPKNLRRTAMVYMGLSLGLRPKEISSVTLDDIMFEKREICILDRKNTTPARLPLPETTILIIAAYILEERPETESRRLFINLYAPYKPIVPNTVTREIKIAMQQAGLSSSAYWLRHTYAQNLLEADVSIFEIKEMMGHDSLQTTKRYLHIHIKLMTKVLFDED